MISQIIAELQTADEKLKKAGKYVNERWTIHSNYVKIGDEVESKQPDSKNENKGRKIAHGNFKRNLSEAGRG